MYSAASLPAALSSLIEIAPKKIILDTDTYNEVDDQFALAWALLCGRVELCSVNAAPFFNSRSVSPRDGMEKSLAEIKHILSLVGRERPVFSGSTRFMAADGDIVESDAARNIINAARKESDLYVVAIGAITNVASALLQAPDIAAHMTVVWLGGHAYHWPDTREFNMVQDVYAARAVFDSGVRLLQLPCMGVVSGLATTVPELESCIGGKNALCDYLVKLVRGYTDDPFAWSKPIWDASAIAIFAVPEACDIVSLPRPTLTDDCAYAPGKTDAPPVFYLRAFDRDKIFADLFRTLSEA